MKKIVAISVTLLFLVLFNNITVFAGIQEDPEIEDDEEEDDGGWQV